MNDSVPVAATPPARDHAPPDRGQEPAPSDAFAAALGAAQPAEAPPPADPSARTAPAEGTKAEGDSSGPHIRKTARTHQPVAARAAAAASALAPAAPDQVVASPAAGAAAGVTAPAPVAEPAPVTLRQAANPVPVNTRNAGAPKAPAGDTAASPAQQPAAATAEPSAGQPSAETAPAGAAAGQGAAGAVAAETVAAEAVPADPAGGTVRSRQRPIADRPARPERSQGRAERRTAPEHATPVARPTHVHATPVTQREPAAAQAPDVRSADAPAPARAVDATQAPAADRTAEPGRIAERPAPDQAEPDVRPRVRLRDVPDLARATMRVAVKSGGGAMARISLHPADLGGVRITMRVHDGTVAATLAAETPAAAQALTQTVSDLRRSLEGQGLQIASLDVHVAGDGPASSGDRRHAPDLEHTMKRTDGAASDDVVDITTELHLVPLGTQVDVLA